MKARLEEEVRSAQLVSHLMFKLLPLQMLLVGVSVANDIVSSLFASNAVGVDSMAAIGLYSPIISLISAISILLASGSQILASQFMGKNEIERMRGIFTLNIILTFVFGIALVVLHLFMVAAGITDILASDPSVCSYLDQYVLGKTIGLLPFLVGMQLSAFLSVENQIARTTLASIAFIVSNIAFHVWFVVVLHLQAFGMALASSLGSCIFAGLLVLPYITGKTSVGFSIKTLHWRDMTSIFKLGSPDALVNVYFMIRALVFNAMILASVGTVGLSAYTTVYTFMFVFWTLPDGMLAVSRMLIGVSVGEEDRQTLVDIMRVMFSWYVPLMIAVSAVVCLCAEPLTKLYYHDPSQEVYQMTVWGFRIFPWCLPLSIISMHFSCYGNTMGKSFYVHVITLMDGMVCVLAFGALLLPLLHINATYLAYVLRGVAICVFVLLYAWHHNGRRPQSMADLMMIPRDFGVEQDARLDLCVRSVEEVVTVSQQVRAFCKERGVDARRTLLAGLALEEMAGNVVKHGFTSDKRRHSADIRVVHKDDDLILRIKDDCAPFNPAERREMIDPQDKTKGIGIRMVFSIASTITYQQILGMNVLTIRI